MDIINIMMWMTRSQLKLDCVSEKPSQTDVWWRKSRVVPTVIMWELFPDEKKKILKSSIK